MKEPGNGLTTSRQHSKMDKMQLGFGLLLLVAPALMAQDTIELETTTIKGNKELPKILYIVPWKDVKSGKQSQQELVLHSLSDDLFDPMLPLQF